MVRSALRAGGADYAFPGIVERLRGTPARLEERVRRLSPRLLTRRPGERWSIQENVGHLGDLEPLWAGRLDDLLAGRGQLRPADLQNRRTHDAAHNDRDLEDLLGAFRAARMATVGRLDVLDSQGLRASARHPRLEQPMTAVDLFLFVAEHDDHHLAGITELVSLVDDGA